MDERKNHLTISKQNSQVKVDNKHVKRPSSHMLSKNSFNNKLNNNGEGSGSKVMKYKTIKELKLQMEKVKSDQQIG